MAAIRERDLLLLQPLEHLVGRMETTHSTQTHVRRTTSSLKCFTPAQPSQCSCFTNQECLQEQRGTPLSGANIHPVIFRHITLLKIPPFFFLPVMNIMQAHVCLFEVKFDFCSQCCDVDTLWSSCPRWTDQAERRINALIWRCQELPFCQVFQKDILCNLSPWGEY